MEKIKVSTERIQRGLRSGKDFYVFMEELIELGRKQGRKEASMEIIWDILEAEKND